MLLLPAAAEDALQHPGVSGKGSVSPQQLQAKQSRPPSGRHGELLSPRLPAAAADSLAAGAAGDQPDEPCGSAKASTGTGELHQ